MRVLGPETNFLGLPPPWCDLQRARAVVLPVPYEHTVSYGRGTARGPEAILEASRQVELYDEALEDEPYRWMEGIATVEPLTFPPDCRDAAAVARIEAAVGCLLDRGKFVVSLGGEHTIAIGAVRAYVERFPDVTVLQLDAHSDLRDQYEGNPYSHACTMRRIYEITLRIVQVGIRSQCREDALFIRQTGLAVFPMSALRRREHWQEHVLSHVDSPVYVSFDCDVLDPAILPAVGTPEPGGLLWEETLGFLRRLAQERHVVGFDLNELAPIPNLHFPQFTAARLIYKFLGFVFEHAREG